MYNDGRDWHLIKKNIYDAYDKRAVQSSRNVDALGCLCKSSWAHTKYNDDVLYCNSLRSSINYVLNAYYWNRKKRFADGIEVLHSVFLDNIYRTDNLRCETIEDPEFNLDLLSFHISTACLCILCENNDFTIAAKSAADTAEYLFENDEELHLIYSGKEEYDDLYISIVCECWVSYLLLDRNYDVISWYKKQFNWKALKITDNISHIAVKLCYMIACTRTRTNMSDEGMLYGIAGMLSYLKLDWLDANAKGRSWLFQFHMIMLFIYLSKNNEKNSSNNLLSLINELSLDVIFDEITLIDSN